MAEEEKNESTETEADAPSGEEPAPAEEPAVEAPAEEPAEEPAAEEPAAEEPAEEPAAEEPAAEEPAPAEEPEEAAPEEEAAEEAAPEGAPAPQADTAAPAPDAESEAELTPKQRRKRERAAFEGEPGPQRTPEERAAERAARRAALAAARGRRRVQERQGHEAGEGTPPRERSPGAKKIRQGTVLSSKADKTITVKIEMARRHPVYEKVVRRSATVHAHDEKNEASEGDVVRVIESRPLSRTKRWRLVEVMERAR